MRNSRQCHLSFGCFAYLVAFAGMLQSTCSDCRVPSATVLLSKRTSSMCTSAAACAAGATATLKLAKAATAMAMTATAANMRRNNCRDVASMADSSKVILLLEHALPKDGAAREGWGIGQCWLGSCAPTGEGIRESLRNVPNALV